MDIGSGYRKKDTRSESDKKEKPFVVLIHTTGGHVLKMWADHEYIQNFLIEPMSKNPHSCLTQRPSEYAIGTMGFNLAFNQVTYIEWLRIY